MPAIMSSAGRRNAKVKFQRDQGGVSDGAGNTTATWADLCGPYWAQVSPLGGREEVLAQRLTGVQPYSITVLSSSATRAVTTDDRVVNLRTGEILDIVGISNPDERGIELVFLCKSGVAT